MKRRIFILLLATVTVTLFAFTEVFAVSLDPAPVCQDECTAGENTIRILPRQTPTGPVWPVPVLAGDPDYNCGEGVEECLAFPYECQGPSCAGGIFVLIPNCCSGPIDILAVGREIASFPLPRFKDCNHPQHMWPDVCSGQTHRMFPATMTGPGKFLYWFSVPTTASTNMVDMKMVVGGQAVRCDAGIRGPGCVQTPDQQRSDPVTQCYQFAGNSTWVLQYNDPYSPCATDVYAAEATNGVLMSCDDAVDPAYKLQAQSIDTIIDTADNNKKMSLFQVSNTQCNDGWVRFVDENGNNGKCYVTGGRRYCR